MQYSKEVEEMVCVNPIRYIVHNLARNDFGLADTL